MPDATYWAAAAQTMPVLALALVIEARAIIASWPTGRLRAYKRVQGIIWTLPLLIYAVTLPVCFSAMSGNTVWAGWVEVIGLGIGGGAAALIVAPAFELLQRTNARAVARFLSLNPLETTSRIRVWVWRHHLSPTRWQMSYQIWRNDRELVRMDKRLRQDQALAAQRLDMDSDEFLRFVDDTKNQQQTIDMLKQKNNEYRERIHSAPDEFAQQLDEFRKVRQQRIDSLERDLERWDIFNDQTYSASPSKAPPDGS